MADITGRTGTLIDGLTVGRKFGLAEAKANPKDRAELKKSFFKEIKGLRELRDAPLKLPFIPQRNFFKKKKRFFK